MANPRAFTLLELLLAMALSTMLLLGVLAVLTDLGAVGTAPGGGGVLRKGSDPAPVETWAHLLSDDLSHAAHVDASAENKVTLIGYGALDARGRERMHRPVRVVYTLEELDGRPWLIRRQEALDVPTNRNVQCDLVGAGVTRFELVKVVFEKEAAESDLSGAGAAAARQEEVSSQKQDEAVPQDAGEKEEQEEPAAWRLRVWTAAGEAPAYDRIITMRTGGRA